MMAYRRWFRLKIQIQKAKNEPKKGKTNEKHKRPSDNRDPDRRERRGQWDF